MIFASIIRETTRFKNPEGSRIHGHFGLDSTRNGIFIKQLSNY